MEEKQRNQLKRSMKLKAGSLKRYTKLLNFSQTQKERRLFKFKLIKLEMEKGKLQLTLHNTEKHKRLL